MNSCDVNHVKPTKFFSSPQGKVRKRPGAWAIQPLCCCGHQIRPSSPRTKDSTVTDQLVAERNWAGNYSYQAPQLAHPASAEELQGLVAGAQKVRALGS